MPFVISHRGANRLAPENTIPAFEKSLEFGVDGFENDVHMTKDGVLVVCHDDTVDRTSDGHGFICEQTLEELRALDFGSWFSPAFIGTKIPTLAEFFALCGPLRVINVEIKRAPDGSTASAGAVVRLAKEMGVFDRLIISSFDMDMLQACKTADAAARICYLFSFNSTDAEDIADDPVGFAEKYKLYAYHPLALLVMPGFIQACHGAGIVINPWTVNQEHSIVAMRDMGIDGIITDEPELSMRLIYGES